MTRRDIARLDDISEAIAAIRWYVTRGPLTDDLVFDAVRMRLIEIGEAVKALSPELTAGEPRIPWRQVARMRDNLAHRYFASSLLIIQTTVEDDLDPLEEAVGRMRARL